MAYANMKDYMRAGQHGEPRLDFSELTRDQAAALQEVLMTLDIDHMFPWAAWPCGDLWNLLPAHREVNQRLKRDRLPSATTLFRAEGRIVSWWEQAYLSRAESHIPEQFLQEARA